MPNPLAPAPYLQSVLKPDFPIETQRLLVRPLVAADVDAMHAYQSQPDVCRYIPYEPRTKEQIAERLADVDKRNRSTLEEAGQALCVGVELRATGELIGDIILMWHSAEHRAGEIGYVFHPDHAGHGYATEASRVLLELAFDGLGLHRVVGRIDARNVASGAVLKRLGMRQEAMLVENEWFKGEWSSEIIFAMLETEWRAQPK